MHRWLVDLNFPTHLFPSYFSPPPGHGALTCAFRDPKKWASVSAFAPISNPTNCPWGKKAFENYLGSVDAGKDHDATLLLRENGPFETYDDILRSRPRHGRRVS